MKQYFKSIVSILFLVILSIKSLMIPMIYLDFELRRSYISNNLCENRNRPLLNCNGKCYLSKKMAAAQEQEERNAERDYMGKLIEVAANYPIWDTVNSPTARIGTLSTKTDFTYKNSFIDLIESRGIFRPPIC